MSTVQPQAQKLSECRKCKENGFQNVMIYFVQNGFNKSTGKPFWDLKNQDRTPHVHISPMTPAITTQSQATATTPAVPVTSTSGTKEQLQDRINQSHLENISCWTAQTAAIREQTLVMKDLVSSIKLLVTCINNKVLK